MWISSRKHFLELTGKKKEMEKTDSKRTGNSSSAASRAMATNSNQPTNQPVPADQLNTEFQLTQPASLEPPAPPLPWRPNYNSICELYLHAAMLSSTCAFVFECAWPDEPVWWEVVFALKD